GLPQIVLCADRAKPESSLKGLAQMVVIGELPEGVELETKLVVYGHVHGLAGTDHRRRDLMVSLLWGAPIGLAFGLLAAVGAQLSTFVLAGIGTWMGGKVDRTFQWLTQVNVILPVLPILIMIHYFHQLSLWKILGLVIALNVFSASLLTYRAMFLQAKESPYIEAAQAYGVGNMRMVFRYLLPRIAPTLLPQFVLIVPTFVFLEASLAVLGLGDPVLPTWGKVLNDAYTQGALYKGLYYWMILPAGLLMLMGVGFALIGFSLDRIFNPRLRAV
ncbi:MAG: ABC transporter permease, partial [Dehalococcoidia bacterium]